MRRISLSDFAEGVASTLLIRGTVVSATSLHGKGRPQLHFTLLDFFAGAPHRKGGPPRGDCAECVLVSDQLYALDAARGDGRITTLREAAEHLSGAVMTSVLIRQAGDPEHGKATEPCPACASLLAALGIEFIAA